MEHIAEMITLRKELLQLQKIVDKLHRTDDAMFSNLLFTKKEAASQLGVTCRTLERWHSLGYIDHIRVGGRVFFSQQTILDLVNAPGKIREQFSQDVFSRYMESLRQ